MVTLKILDLEAQKSKTGEVSVQNYFMISRYFAIQITYNEAYNPEQNIR